MPHAGIRGTAADKGKLVFHSDRLHGPLGMAMASNGNLLASNSDVINSNPREPSEIVEFTTEGEFVGQFNVEVGQGGSFGLAVATAGKISMLAAVDDDVSSITVYELPQK